MHKYISDAASNLKDILLMQNFEVVEMLGSEIH